MRLHRFVLMTLDCDVGSLASFGADYEGVPVGVLGHTLLGEHRTELTVAARVDLAELPAVDEVGQVEVPDEPRRRAERSLEVVGDLLSVAMGCSRALSSPRTPVAFEAQNNDERDWLGRQTRLATEGAASSSTAWLSRSTSNAS